LLGWSRQRASRGAMRVGCYSVHVCAAWCVYDARDRMQQNYQQVSKPTRKAIAAETSVRSWVPATHLRRLSDHPRDALTYAAVRASIACAACLISSLVSQWRHRNAALQLNGVGHECTRATLHLAVGSELDAGDVHANATTRHAPPYDRQQKRCLQVVKGPLKVWERVLRPW
jgi:hypothetical protein